MIRRLARGYCCRQILLIKPLMPCRKIFIRKNVRLNPLEKGRKMTRTGWLSTVALAAILIGPGAMAAPAGDAVTQWNAQAGTAATKACIAPLDNPFHESRMYAMMHLAIHDALNAIDRRYQPYAYDQKADPSTSPHAATAAAAHHVLVALIGQLPTELVQKECIDAGIASTEAAYTAALADIPDSADKHRALLSDRLRPKRSWTSEPMIMRTKDRS